MPTLTNIDRDLLAQLAAEPVVRAPNTLQPDIAQLNKLVEYGLGCSGTLSAGRHDLPPDTSWAAGAGGAGDMT